MKNCSRCGDKMDSETQNYLKGGETKKNLTKEFHYLVTIKNTSSFHKSTQKRIENECSRNNPIIEMVKEFRKNEEIDSLIKYYKKERQDRLNEVGVEHLDQSEMGELNEKIGTNRDISINDLIITEFDYIGNEDELVSNNNNPVIGTFFDTKKVKQDVNELVCDNCVREKDDVIW